MKRVNRFKQTLDDGRVALGTCVDSYSPAVMEVAGSWRLAMICKF